MPHRHVAAQLILIASYIIVLTFTVDTLVGGHPNSVPLRALKQSINQ